MAQYSEALVEKQGLERISITSSNSTPPPSNTVITMPTDDSAQTPIDKILIELGRLVVTWNALERTFSSLLEEMTNGGFPVKLLTVYASSTTICSAMRSYASDLLPAHEAKHIHHAITYFEILRAYRDYYIHGPVGTFGLNTDIPMAQMYTYSVSSKKRYTVHSEALTDDDLKYVITHCATLRTYLEEIDSYFAVQKMKGQGIVPPETDIFDRAGHRVTGRLPADTPLLPQRLMKPKRLLSREE